MAFFQTQIQRCHRDPVFAWRIFLGAFIVLFLGLLITADMPWGASLLERMTDDRMRPQDYAQLVLAPAYAFALVVGLILFASAGWWASPLNDRPEPQKLDPAPLIWRGLLLGAILVCLVLRWPLATNSLWWDEIWNIRHTIVGEASIDPDKPQEIQVRERDWMRTFWYYLKPTNHVGYTVPARAAHEVWKVGVNAPPHAFSEWVIRLPSLLASVGTVFLAAILLRRWGFALAGLALAWLLATHPWFIRYGVDARAFSLNMFLTLWSLLTFVEAYRTWKWKWWFGWGLGLFYLLWAFPYNMFWVAGQVSTMGLLVVLHPNLALTNRLHLLCRPAVAGILAAILLLVLAAPWVPQILDWTDVQGNEMINWSVAESLWIASVFGLPMGGSLEAGIVSYGQLVKQWPLLGWVAFGLMPMLALIGAVCLILKGRPFRLLTALLITIVPATMVYSWTQTYYFYERYVIHGSVIVCLLVVLGVAGLGECLSRLLPKFKMATPVLLMLFLAAHLMVTLPARHLLLERPIAPSRQVANFFLTQAGDEPDSIIRIGYGLGGNTPDVYDPWIRWATDRETLDQALTHGLGESKPVFVFYGYPTFNRANSLRMAEGDPSASAFAVLDDSIFFEQVATFHGIEPDFTYTILRVRQ
ncbi:MAG: hypothetical protein ACFCU3_01165 [Verrucomicrobiales bacterium]